MRELEGKVAVVTGGASGIGLALAQSFALHGMRIVLADVERAALDRAADELREGGAEVLAVETDVSVGESVEALATRTFGRFGTAHIVCNNAGVGPGGVTWEIPVRAWEWVLGVDLWGVIHGIRAFVPRLVQQGEGHVVNTASVAGLIASPGMAPYAAAKHAVVGLSQSLAHDLQLAGSAVRVSVLCPSATRTAMNQSGRNWPARLGDPPDTGLEPGHPATRHRYGRLHDGSAAEPTDVADEVVAAVRSGAFWVITDPDRGTRLPAHVRGMLDGILPELPR